MLAQRRRRWASIEPALGERLVFAGLHYTCSEVQYIVRVIVY